MIRLVVAPYCHQCTEFEAETTKAQSIAFGVLTGEDVHTVVQCEHRDKCQALYENIEKSVLQKEAERERKRKKDLYAVMLSIGWNSTGPFYDSIYCICSTQSAAEDAIEQLNKKRVEYRDAKIVHMVLDEIPD